MSGASDPISPEGIAQMRAEYDQLIRVDRPAVVEIVSWAAGNGDRSENGDYIYGRQKLREMDRRAAHLAQRIKAVQVVDVRDQADRSRVWFGATVSFVGDDERERAVTLVGIDEADASAGVIGWTSPVARALRGGAVGDIRHIVLPAGEMTCEIVSISYPD